MLLSHRMERVATRERLERYLRAYALNTAGVVNDNTLYEAAGINRKTAGFYEQLLINLMAVERTPAWSTNHLKRLIRISKAACDRHRSMGCHRRG